MKGRKMFEEWKDFIVSVALGGLLAAFSGAIGYLHRQVSGKRAISWLEGVVRALGSGVVGMLVAMLCVAMELSIPWTGFLVGTAGWLGADITMVLLEKIVHKRIGL